MIHPLFHWFHNLSREAFEQLEVTDEASQTHVEFQSGIEKLNRRQFCNTAPTLIGKLWAINGTFTKTAKPKRSNIDDLTSLPMVSETKKK